MTLRPKRWIGVLFLALCCACGKGESPTPKAGPAQVAEAKYVGKETCRPCHTEIASTYSRTGMGRSWYPMVGAPEIEDWTNKNSFTVPSTGLRYKMTKRDAKYYVRQSISDGRGGETAVDERELVWAVGSANHSRQYLVVQDGKMFQAPVCWHTQVPVWDLCPGYEFDNFYFARETGTTCVSCHNDPMTLKAGARNAFEEPIPHGIGCERCHGPGDQHVAKWEHGATPTGQADPTIVNPKRLTAELRMNICFRCHLGDSKASERVSLYQGSLEEWRPGKPITAAVIPFRFVEKTVHHFGLSGQVDRMMMSRCYTESGGAMECVTCHNPHVTSFRDDRPADAFIAKCLGCHTKAECTAPAAKRAATKPADNCVTCHMRKGVPDDQRHVLYTDHWIRARIDQPEVARTKFDVEPFFPETLAKLSPADRAYYTARAIQLRTHHAPPDARKTMFPQAEAKFREAIAAGYAKAEGPYFLGLVLMEQGKRSEAADAFEEAYRKDPADFDIAFAHGQSLLRQKRVPEAEQVFAALAVSHPEAAGPFAEQARARAEHEDFNGALELFRKAIAREPWNASLRVNAATMLSALERHPEAVAEAEQALRCDPEGAKTWRAYEMLLGRAGRAGDAEAAGRRAQQLAKAPGLRLSNVKAM
jgi:Tfp pilus assembly protein PilF